MFTTIEQTKELTGYDVTRETILMAQAIIESYVGRVEVEVVNAGDQMLLSRACAYQAAYMNANKDTIFEQMNAFQVTQFGQMVTFQANNMTAPWVAPLAVLACHRLSWKRMRSVKTGSIYDAKPVGTFQEYWRTD